MEKKEKKRRGWDEYFMDIAELVATRATCNRGSDLKYMPGFKGVGAVIVRDRTVLSSGYNGSPRGLDHCDDIGHEMVEGHCIRTVHAEANALIQAAKNGIMIDGGGLYTTASPCYDCFKMLVNAGIKRIVCGAFYGSRYGASDKVVGLAAQAGVQMEFLRADKAPDQLDLPKPKPEEKETEAVKSLLLSSNLKIRKLHPMAKVPDYAHEGDAGLDLYASEGASIPAGQRERIKTGISMEIPDGYVGLIWDRSSVPVKKGLKTMGGVIDSGYRGEILVPVVNVSGENVEVMQGEKIAQIIIQPFEQVEVEETDGLGESARGEGAFGSSDELVESEELVELEEEAVIEEEEPTIDEITKALSSASTLSKESEGFSEPLSRMGGSEAQERRKNENRGRW